MHQRTSLIMVQAIRSSVLHFKEITTTLRDMFTKLKHSQYCKMWFIYLNPINYCHTKWRRFNPFQLSSYILNSINVIWHVTTLSITLLIEGRDLSPKYINVPAKIPLQADRHNWNLILPNTNVMLYILFSHHI